jgi:DNA-binding MarR family transcriptional regulator
MISQYFHNWEQIDYALLKEMNSEPIPSCDISLPGQNGRALHLQEKISSDQELLDLLSLTPTGRELLKQLLPLMREKKLTIQEMKPSHSGMPLLLDQPRAVAQFIADPDPKRAAKGYGTIFVAKEGPIAMLLGTFAHEASHAVDEELRKEVVPFMDGSADRKYSKSEFERQLNRIKFKTERKAHETEYRFRDEFLSLYPKCKKTVDAEIRLGNIPEGPFNIQVMMQDYKIPADDVKDLNAPN